MLNSGDCDGVEPEIVVLLATFNGARWIPQQVASILDQQGVGVRIIAADDGSTDGTLEWLRELASREPRLTVLEDPTPTGSSAANFYRLLRSVDTGNALVAFADQDDIWMPGKLRRHAALLARGFDGVSSSVTSFTATGKRTLVRKDYPQRPRDYLLESPGPGSTFLLTPRLAQLTRELLSRPDAVAPEVDFHDSLIYAIARSHGWSWHIDGESSVDYRQHDDNVMGSNTGLAAALSRLKLIRSHWLRNHAVLLTRVAIQSAPPSDRPELERILHLLTATGFRSRLVLARMCGQMRRRPRDQRIIALLVAIGVW
ncbi:rhamnosyltransferase [Salinibacterium sp. CAN_S4]|uniref:glycosyltransferase n=1 Tax=Salinibacterium sp. CAN_S4 TaxID=2787727 RepID=UPI0018F00C54